MQFWWKLCHDALTNCPLPQSQHDRALQLSQAVSHCLATLFSVCTLHVSGFIQRLSKPVLMAFQPSFSHSWIGVLDEVSATKHFAELAVAGQGLVWRDGAEQCGQ